jgi:lipoprotein-anchoring transpeptidase ErfK/SrfK
MGAAPTTAHAAAAGPPPSLTVTPATDAKGVPISAEIGTQVTNGTVTTVTVTSTDGETVLGSMRPDGSSWVPSHPLRFSQHYTASVTVTGTDGQTKVSTTAFDTMPQPTTRPISSTINVAGDQTYGVGMPIVIDFGVPIPATQRVNIQKRLFVISSPSQVGAWRWFTDSEVMYRPEVFWRPGSQVTVRAALAGMAIGSRLFAKDQSATMAIGRDMRFAVTDSDHQLTITSNGKVIKRYPISMGKPSTPSWSGHFVIMERDYYTVFDTTDEGPGGYRVGVNYAERLTWSGMFFHSAPWSVYAQGHYNVSHGCVNVGPANAKWIYENSLVGDPVSVAGTPRHAAEGNGWTVWDLNWEDYLQGSAIPLTVSIPTVRVPQI